LYKIAGPRTRAVLVVHPNNPTGSYATEQERASLNQFCREYGLALVVDEVFLDYALDGSPRDSFVGNEDTLTFTLSGISKISGLPQMKLAWIVVSGPGKEVGEALNRLEIIADTYLSMNAPIQLAASALLTQRKSIQPVLLDRVRENLGELDRRLGKQKSCTRLEVEGGWYAVLRVPATQPDEDLAIALLQEAGVLVHPGHFYDFPSDGYLVLSLITPPSQFQEGTAQMLQFLDSRT
jgi:alanine-synthesizing transaminase